MAIIYSYPLESTPTTNDLLLGTSISDDSKPTKTFTIGSLAALVTADANNGTVTEVSTANSTFINLTGGTIINTGTLTASLSATGTPSSSTFLRGDNKWMPASTSGVITLPVLDEGSIITNEVSSFNFTGAGVTVTNDGSDNITIQIPAATGGVSRIIAGTGIGIDAATGDVTVSNTGVRSLVAGTNVTLSPITGLGNVTVNATNNPGTVQSIIPGDGLVLDSGTLTTNPVIGVSYSGSNNYILNSSSLALATSDDIIAFNKISSNDVKTTTLGEIPISALPKVQKYIDDADEPALKNNTDTYTTTAKVMNVVSLTTLEYGGIATPDPNTLYIIATGPVSANDVVLTTITNGIISPDGTGTGTGYILSGDTPAPKTQSGIEGEPYSFKVIATPQAGYYFSTPVSGNVTSGTIPSAASTNVTMTLAGEIVAVPTPEIKATLLVVTDIQGGPASAYNLTGDVTGATQSTLVASSLTYSFTTAISIVDPTAYSWAVAPTIVQAAGTINGSQTVVTTITGTLQLI